MLLSAVLLLTLSPALTKAQQSDTRTLDRQLYHERLRGMWLGQSIANWTGLNTEGFVTEPPFLTDADWGTTEGRWQVIDFICEVPWGSDDDTDIEYVYLHLMNQHQTIDLTPEQISDGWQRHINNFIWVSNETARELFNDSVLPPMTGMIVANENALMIDAQLTTEFFGAIAPGMPATALEIANLPILTSSSGYAAHAAQFFVVLYALAADLDTAQPSADDIVGIVREARRYIPDTSKSADIVDFVLAEYLANPDKSDWERTRDAIYTRYEAEDSENDFQFQIWYESSINFASGLLALLYGEGDFVRTVQIGTLSGWDSDNGTATMGGLLGLIYGRDGIASLFEDDACGTDTYNIYRTRDALPDYLQDDPAAEDSFALMADRMLPLVDLAVERGGGVDTEAWRLPALSDDPLAVNPLQQLYLASANNAILRAGLQANVSYEGGEWSSENLQAAADGIEHDFSGREPDISQVASFMVDGDADGQLILTVTYDRPVLVNVIRFIEGEEPEAGGGCATLVPSIEVDGAWSTPAAYTVSPDPSESNDTSFQAFDMTLPAAIELTGIRLSCQTNSANYISIAELDGLFLSR